MELNLLKCITMYLSKSRTKSGYQLTDSNCRGLNSKIKVLQLKDYLERYEIDICFFQETYFNSKNDLSFLEESLKHFYICCPLSETKSRGVGILIKNYLVKEENLSFQFFENRSVSLDLNFAGKKLSFVNKYSPNLKEEQTTFIEHLYIS